MPEPGTASFLLLVNNTGNVEDAYKADITGTGGPITASLIGLDGQPTPAIPLFRLPGLATGGAAARTAGRAGTTGPAEAVPGGASPNATRLRRSV